MGVIDTDNLAKRVSSLLLDARKKVLQTVNHTMVITYFEIGRLIIEEEQNGKERAAYGKQLITELSKRLTGNFGKGFSQRNLEQMRKFYLVYSIPQTLSALFEFVKSETVSRILRKLYRTVLFVPNF